MLMACRIFDDGDHNYVLGDSVTNAFAIGMLGDSSDFFLLGFPPDAESPTSPVLNGQVFDSSGNLLFRLVRNHITVNPYDCQVVTGGFVGFEIVDNNGHAIIRVETTFDDEYNQRTTIAGEFYDRLGNLVCVSDTTTGDSFVEMAPGMPSLIGMMPSGSIGMNFGMDAIGMEAVRLAMQTASRILFITTGEFIGQDLDMDGRFFRDVYLRSCKLTISRGEFALGSNVTLDNCTIETLGPAAVIADFLMQLRMSSQKGD